MGDYNWKIFVNLILLEIKDLKIVALQYFNEWIFQNHQRLKISRKRENQTNKW